MAFIKCAMKAKRGKTDAQNRTNLGTTARSASRACIKMPRGITSVQTVTTASMELNCQTDEASVTYFEIQYGT